MRIALHARRSRWGLVRQSPLVLSPRPRDNMMAPDDYWSGERGVDFPNALYLLLPHARARNASKPSMSSAISRDVHSDCLAKGIYNDRLCCAFETPPRAEIEATWSALTSASSALTKQNLWRVKRHIVMCAMSTWALE